MNIRYIFRNGNIHYILYYIIYSYIYVYQNVLQNVPKILINDKINENWSPRVQNFKLFQIIYFIIVIYICSILHHLMYYGKSNMNSNDLIYIFFFHQDAVVMSIQYKPNSIVLLSFYHLRIRPDTDRSLPIDLNFHLKCRTVF